MEHLMNGAFYRFLISHCTIGFFHYADTFDWIPFQVRKQLVLLLDAWKAAKMRLKDCYFQSNKITPSPDSGEIDRAFAEEKECWRLFDLALRKAYQDAEKLRQVNEQYGVLTAPVPDLAFCRYVCEHEIYEARLAAGEPVVFYEGRCCLHGYLGELVYPVIPGPFPGLQYYELADETFSRTDKFFWELSLRVRNDRTVYTPISMDYSGFAYSAAHLLSMKSDNVIGPATYAEYSRQSRNKDQQPITRCYQ